VTSVLLSSAAIAVLGFLLVRSLLGAPGSNRAATVLQGVLGIGLGLGIASVSGFVTAIVADGYSDVALLVELGILIGAAATLYRFARTSREWTVAAPKSNSPTALVWVLGVACLAAAGFLLWRSVVASAIAPHGDWDAWAIWNARARFFSRAEDNWAGAFLVSRGHPDYPLLLPLTVARFWAYLGTETTVVPRAISIGSAFACAALLISALAALRGREQGFLAGLLLLTTSAFVTLAPWQIADLPLAFYYLATVVALCITDRDRGAETNALVVAGAMAGLAAWTKNEGLLFAFLVVAALVVHSIFARARVDAGPRILALLVGLLPFAAAVLFFKLVYAPGNDLVAGQGLSQSLERLSDLGRHQLVVKTAGQQLAAIAGPVGALVLSYTLLRRSGPARKDWQLGTGAATALSVLLATMVGYYLVYVLTPKDLAWHLSTSLTRLIMQLWPSLLFLMFMAASPPKRSDGLAT
jgi:hypothetical protein